MAEPKLRMIFYEDKNIPLSYYHLERTEGLRVIAILKALREIKEWTPASTISKMINARLPATLSTISKMAGAERIDLRLPDRRKIIAKKPVLLVRKREYSTGKNTKKLEYLRPPVYVKRIRKCKGRMDIRKYYHQIFK